MAKKNITLDGIRLRITDPALGAGGQGKAQKAVLADDPKTELVIKTLPATPEAITRTSALVDADLSSKSPFLSGPITMETRGDTIWHLAPFVEGVDLENDQPRSFPEQLEIAHNFACQWAIFEENGMAHGDIAPSNTMLNSDGLVSLIDVDNARISDPAAPSPTMAGQRMMLAPEIRDGNQPPTIESDRFAAAVLLNMILLSRHPADQWATPPSALDQAMVSGSWPERHRTSQQNDTPLEAIGSDLCALFDQAFALDPNARPSADTWRRRLLSALQNCWIHRCGQAFVGDASTTACPWCADPVTIKDTAGTLLIVVPAIQGRFRTPIKHGETIRLGRANLAGLPGTVSSKHLEISRQGDRLFLRHIGSNPTLIERNGQWWKLNELWIKTSELAGVPVALKLADTDLTLQM